MKQGRHHPGGQRAVGLLRNAHSADIRARPREKCTRPEAMRVTVNREAER